MGLVNNAIKSIGQGATDINAVTAALKGMSVQNAATVLTTTALTEAEKLQILMDMGLTQEKAKEILANASLTASNAAAAASTGVLAGATTSLTAAFKGLGAAIKSNPILFIASALLTVISFVKTQIDNFKQSLSEANQELINQGKEIADNTSKMEEAYQEFVKYNKLIGTGEENSEGLSNAINSLNETLGSNKVAFDSATGSAEDYANSVDNAIKKTLEQSWLDAKKAATAAENELEDVANVSYTYKNSHQNSSLTPEQKIIDEMMGDYITTTRKKVGKGRVTYYKISPDDLSDMDSVVDYYYSLLAVQNELARQDLDNTDVYDNVTADLGKLKAGVDAYVKAKYNELKLEYEYQNGIPKTQEEYNKLIEFLTSATSGSKGLSKQIKILATQDNKLDFSNAGSGTQEAADKIATLRAKLSNEINIIKEAISEFGSSGNISSETYKKVIALNKDYADLFDFSNGKIEIASDKVNDLADELIEQYGASLAANGATENEIADFTRLISVLKTTAKSTEDYTDKLNEMQKQVDDTISVLQSFYDILKDVQGGKEYGTFEMFELLNTYPQLANCLVETANGYKLEEDALTQLMIAKAKATKVNNSFARSTARQALSAKDSSKAEMVDNLFEKYDIKSWEDFVSAYENEGRFSLIPGYKFDEEIENYVNAYVNDKVQDEMLDYILGELESGKIKTGESEQYKKFQDIQSNYEKEIDKITHLENEYNRCLDELEANGQIGSAKYYEMLQDVERQNIDALTRELAELQTAFDTAIENGEIERGSEEWHEMNNAIIGVKESIGEAELAIIKYGNSIRDLDLEYFDYQQKKISKLTEEADFLIDLLENKDLHDEAGKLTSDGLAVMGLHGVNYNVYLHQAEQYASEIAEIDEKLANDPYNQDLIDRREELLDLQRDMIAASEDEKQAIVDLVQEGIDLQLDALQELIDKYTDALDNAKSLYEYQNKINDATSDIATLQKQLIAYENDESDETRAKVQQIKVDLEEAQESLRESEYDQFITDQKKLLDELYNDYSDVLNANAEDITRTINEAIGAINGNAETISSSINGIAASVGLELTEDFASIFNATNGVGSIVSEFVGANGGFTTSQTAIKGVLDGIAADVLLMRQASDAKAEEEDKEDIVIETTPPPEPEVTPPTTESDKNSGVSVQIGGGLNINPNGGSYGSQIQAQTNAKKYHEELDKLFAEQYKLNNGAFINNDILSRRLKFLSTTDEATLKSELEWFKKYFETKNAPYVSSSSSTTEVPEGVIVANKEIRPSGTSSWNSYNGNSSTIVGGAGISNGNLIINPGNTNPIKPQSSSTLSIGTGSSIVLKRYAKGGLVDYTGLAMLDGTKSKPETVLDAEDTQNFLGLRDVLAQLARDDISIGNPLYSSFAPISYANSVPNFADKMAQILNTENSNTAQEIHIENHIEIDHVEDYDDLVTKMQSDRKFENMIISMTLGRATGGGSLKKYKSKWK